MKIIQNLINKIKERKAKCLMKKIQKKKKHIDNLKEDIIKMAEKLKLVNGKLIKVNEEEQTPTPKVETPQPKVEEPKVGIVRDVPEEDDDFPEDITDEDVTVQEQPIQEQVDAEFPIEDDESDGEPTRGVLVLNIQDSEPLQMIVPIDALDDTIERIKTAMEEQRTIVIENVILNAKFIITFSALVQ